MPLTRRHLLLAGLGLPAAAAQQKAAAPRPNIVLVVADELAAWMLGCYGNKEIRTPNIDRLARMGTRFSNCFTLTPACAASHATLFTGRAPAQHGIHDVLAGTAPAGFAREVLLSTLLSGEGYECGFAGKWHLGNEEQPQHGFRFWYAVQGETRLENPSVSREGKRVEEKGYLGDLITAAADGFLGRQSESRPFFLTVDYPLLDPPYEGHPEKYSGMYAQTTFETIGWLPAAPNADRHKEMLQDAVGNLRKAAAAVTALDDQVGALYKSLQAHGLLNSTLVIFTGDHGSLLGRHGLWSGGAASDPPNMFEEVMQVPLLWSWLGRIPAENMRPELVDFCDFFPTVAEAAGVEPPQDRNLPGRSFLPLAANKPLPKKQPWRNLVFGHYRNTWMARDFRYKVVVRDEGRGPNELYDLRTDAGELRNHYDNPQFVVTRDRLWGELAAWQKKYGAGAAG